MKRIIFLIVVLAMCGAAAAQLQQGPIARAERPLLVERNPNWGRDHLMVLLYYPNPPVTLDYQNAKLKPFDVITEVDGVSTEGMSVEWFYQICDSKPETMLRVLRKRSGANHELTVTGNFARTFRSGFSEFDIARDYQNEQHSKSWLNNSRFMTMWSALWVDFFEFNTYDFIVDDTNLFFEEGILKKFMDTSGFFHSMLRNSEDPDVLFQMVWTQEPETGLYMRFVVLDARDESMPVVWEMTFIEPATKESDILQKTQVMASWAAYPFDSPRLRSVDFGYGGINYASVWKTSSSVGHTVWSIVGDIAVDEGSPAYNVGFRDGDKLKVLWGVNSKGKPKRANPNLYGGLFSNPLISTGYTSPSTSRADLRTHRNSIRKAYPRTNWVDQFNTAGILDIAVPDMRYDHTNTKYTVRGEKRNATLRGFTPSEVSWWYIE